MNLDQLDNLIEGGEVRRFHAHPVHVHQTNMHHGARVALFARFILPHISSKLLLACILHDAAEIETGDIPSPAKRKYPALKEEVRKIHETFEADNCVPEILPKEQQVLKICDYLETILFCAEEAQLGNQGMNEIFNNCAAQVSERVKDLPDDDTLIRTGELVHYVTTRYRYAIRGR